jgi:excisionase family DNA binding protein
MLAERPMASAALQIAAPSRGLIARCLSPVPRKRPQSSAALKFWGRRDDIIRMSAPTPSLTRGSRQLVFTSSQAAVYLGVSLATIRRWTDAGHINCYRTPGGQRRFSREQLDGFIESMAQGVAEAEQPAD